MAPSYFWMTLNQTHGPFTDGYVGYCRVVRQIRSGQPYREAWRLGTGRNKISEGDIVSIRRENPKKKAHLPGGLIARETISRPPFDDDWTRDSSCHKVPVLQRDKPHWQVEFVLDSLLGPQELTSDVFGTPFASGTPIKPEKALRIEAEWARLLRDARCGAAH